jgi:hypothetical protein
MRQSFGIELMSLKRRLIASSNNTLVGFEKGEDVKVISDL